MIRFSGPLFATPLVLAVALCAYRFLRTSDAALIAAALMALWPVIRGIRTPSEIERGTRGRLLGPLRGFLSQFLAAVGLRRHHGAANGVHELALGDQAQHL